MGTVLSLHHRLARRAYTLMPTVAVVEYPRHSLDHLGTPTDKDQRAHSPWAPQSLCPFGDRLLMSLTNLHNRGRAYHLTEVVQSRTDYGESFLFCFVVFSCTSHISLHSGALEANEAAACCARDSRWGSVPEHAYSLHLSILPSLRSRS